LADFLWQETAFSRMLAISRDAEARQLTLELAQVKEDLASAHHEKMSSAKPERLLWRDRPKVSLDESDLVIDGEVSDLGIHTEEADLGIYTDESESSSVLLEDENEERIIRAYESSFFGEDFKNGEEDWICGAPENMSNKIGGSGSGVCSAKCTHSVTYYEDPLPIKQEASGVSLFQAVPIPVGNSVKKKSLDVDFSGDSPNPGGQAAEARNGPNMEAPGVSHDPFCPQIERWGQEEPSGPKQESPFRPGRAHWATEEEAAALVLRLFG
jgi:hypothetical protein